MKTPTEIKVVRRGHGTMAYTADWQDAEAAYHVWFTEDRAPKEPIIYVNRHDTYGKRDHKASRRALSANPKIAKALAMLPCRLFDDADMVALAKEHRETQERRRARIAELAVEA